MEHAMQVVTMDRKYMGVIQLQSCFHTSIHVDMSCMHVTDTCIYCVPHAVK